MPTFGHLTERKVYMTVESDIWRFLDTGKGSAMFNMDLDVQLFDEVRHGGQPFIRLYGWESPAITTGYSQNAADIFDLARCASCGVDVVRRPTGGRAVFHDKEVAYSVSAPIADDYFGGSITETYKRISEVIRSALVRLGVNVRLSPGTIEKADVSGRFLPCFISVSKFELTAGGKKIVGSAQCRQNGCFLQQGSILLGPGQEVIADYLLDSANADSFREYIRRQSTDISTETGGKISEHDLISELKISFQHILGHAIIDAEIKV